MFTKSNKEPAPTKSLPGNTRIILGLALFFLFGLGGYYFFFVQKKSTYLINRNFRLLSAMGAQVRDSVATQGRVLENLTNKRCFFRELMKDDVENPVWREKKRATLAAISPMFKDIGIEPSAGPGQAASATGCEEEENSYGGNLKGTLSHKLELSPGGYSLRFAYAKPEAWTLQGTVKLDHLLEAPFRSRGAFEAVLLADAHGKVVHQRGAPSLSITDLAPLLEEKIGRKDWSRQSADRPLLSYSRYFDVELSGKEYRLFIEPIKLPFGSKQPAHEGVWLICGLIPQGEFFYKSLAVSSALLTFIIGSLLLMVLSWPFIKLRLIGATQRVLLLDVILLGVCSVLGTSIATVGLHDFFAFQELMAQSEGQLERLSEQLERNLKTEIQAAYRQLVKIEEAKKIDPTEEGNHLYRGWSEPRSFSKLYPFLGSFMFLDAEGRQTRKWSTSNIVSPRISLAERAYFQRARDGELWTLTMGDAKVGPLVIEPVVTWTTGERVAILARRVEGFKHPVSMLSIPMVSLIDPVLPPGFEFAILNNEDPDGQVVFHSDAGRNGVENFFSETDRDRRLRSAVFARRSESMSLRYWGKDYLAHVRPVKDLPWTIVALRDKQMLRAVNIEWILSTMMFILGYVGALTLVLCLVAAIRPRYRASWTWPDFKRQESYLVLLCVYSLLIVAFALAIYFLRGSAELVFLSACVPFLALLLSYLVLRGQLSRHKKIAATTGGAILGLLMGFELLRSPVESGGWPGVRWIVLLLFLAAVLVAVRLPEGWRERISVRNIKVAQLYPLAGLFLLILTAVLPALGFFETARRIQFESFVRHGQLRLAMALKDRESRVQKTLRRGGRNDLDCSLKERLAIEPEGIYGLDVYSAPFFHTEIHVLSGEVPTSCRAGSAVCYQSSESRVAVGERQQPGPCCGYQPRKPTWMSALFEELLPRSSEYAVEMRELLHQQASDETWHWKPEDRRLILHSKDYPGGDLVVVSRPLDRPGDVEDDRRASELQVESAGLVSDLPNPLEVLLFLPLAGILTWLVLFIARRVFLLDLAEPLWMASTGELSSMVGGNIFLVNRRKRWHVPDRENFFVLSIEDIADASARWLDRRLDLIRSLNDRNILVEGFEERVFAPALNEKVLSFLEELVNIHQRNVIVLSTVNPTLLLFQDSLNDNGAAEGKKPPSIEGRWRNLFSSFTLINEDLRAQEGSSSLKSSVLQAECGSDPFLLRIGRELDPHARSRSREQLLEEFGERAERYYRAIWASCSPEEEVVLEHLAEEGFANEKNRRVIRRLMVRRLIHRAPNLCLMNETFRRFVISANCKSTVLSLEKDAGPSAWDRFRLPFFAGLSASLIFFFSTQQALLEGTAATITGLAAGLPALIQMLDLFGGSRSSHGRFIGPG